MAQIFPVDIVAPGALGLNSENANVIMPPSYCTEALNAVINRSGRIAARKGWLDLTTTGISGNHSIKRIFEQLSEAGTSTIISTANNKIYSGYGDFTDVANDITSTTAPTADYWQFVNFNNSVIGVQRGHNAIRRGTTGDFADISFTGTGPDGNCIHAAFGRLWGASSDKQTLRYSSLLSYDDWSTGSGGGNIDMSSLWTMGMDEIVAVSSVGANLVVFGRNHIVLWADGTGSEIGMTPASMQVVDTIEGTGCIARDSVCPTGEGDLLFLSRHGVQSLGRVIEEKSNPLTTLSRPIRSTILESIVQTRGADANFDTVLAVVSPEEGFYIINFPLTSSMFVFDTQHPYQDDYGEVLFPITQWNMGGTIVGMCAANDGNLYLGSLGVMGKYYGEDDNGSAYDFQFMTGWLDFGEQNHYIKMLKDLSATVSIGRGSVTWRWEWDFSGDTLTRTQTYEGSTPSQFGISEYTSGLGPPTEGYADPAATTLQESEYSGGLIIVRKTVPAYGEGQFLKVGCTSSVSGFDLVIQQISMAPKIGRMVI